MIQLGKIRAQAQLTALLVDHELHRIWHGAARDVVDAR